MEPTDPMADIDSLFSVAKQERIVAGKLILPPEYQRPLKEHLVKRIMREFNPYEFLVLLVSQRMDGNYYLIDGQNRIEALRRMGWLDQNVDCLVFRGISLEQEAHIFWYTTKNRLAIRPAERFRAQLVSREADAIWINATVESYGFTLNLTSGGVRAVSALDCIGAIERVIATYGRVVLMETLEVMRDSWRNGSQKIQGNAMIGLSRFIRRYQNNERYDRRRLVHILQQHVVADIESGGRRLKDARKKMPLPDAYGQTILDLYNNRLSESKRLPDWYELQPSGGGDRRSPAYQASKENSADGN